MDSLPLRLHECTWTEARERLRTAHVAILPFGANEAQGPHLPMAADAVIAGEMALRGAAELRRRGVEALVLPTVPYGVSYASWPFPGTIVISPATLHLLTADIGRNLARHGLRYLLLASAHLEPSQLEALAAAAWTLELETPLNVAVLDIREPRWAERLSEEFRRGARHGGSYGTSLVWAARPDLVRVDEARKLEPVWINLLEAYHAGARTFDQAGSPLAYFGDPARGSPEEGEGLYQALGTIIADSVEGLMGKSARV